MHSGTAVAAPPVASPMAGTDPAVETITYVPIEMAGEISSALPPSAKFEGHEGPADVYATVALEPTRSTRQANIADEMTTSATAVSTLPCEGAQQSVVVRPKYLRVPQLRMTQEVRQWLTGEFIAIHQRARQICVEKAHRMHLEIIELNAAVKRAWEEGSNELVLEVVVNGNLPQSLALWDAIGDEIQSWGRKQPPLRRRLLEEKYAIFVEAKTQP